MNEERIATIDCETAYKLNTALNSIYELAANLYEFAFGYTFCGALESDPRVKNDKGEMAFAWMLNHYEPAQSMVLGIRTISELAKEFMPEV